MRLEGEERIRKIMTSKDVSVFVVESYYGYDKSYKSFVGSFFEDEIRIYYETSKVSVKMESDESGLTIYLPTREFKEHFLNKAIPEFTRTTLSSKDLNLYNKIKNQQKT